MGKKRRFHVGLRTVKTAAAIIVAMIVVDQYGATSDKLIFAMLGAMSAVQPTFKESLADGIAQISGVVTGALAGLVLTALPINPLVAIGLGTILIIALYNMFHVTSSPSMPCFVLVMLCVSDSISPLPYASGRIWDTAIGLGIGMLINMLVFPYDNSRQIRETVESLDKDLLKFLEEMFDGDSELPDAERMNMRIADMERQMETFSNQRLLLRLRRQRRELEQFRTCEEMAMSLVSHLEVLSMLERPGRLSDESRRRLKACGAEIRDSRPLDSVMELDVVTNYHVERILSLRRALLEALGSNKAGGK